MGEFILRVSTFAIYAPRGHGITILIRFLSHHRLSPLSVRSQPGHQENCDCFENVGGNHSTDAYCQQKERSIESFKAVDPAELVDVGALDHVDGDVGNRQLLRQVPTERFAEVAARVVEPRPGHDEGDHRDLGLVSHHGNSRPGQIS